MGCIIGLARNARLHAAVEMAEASLADVYTASGSKQRLIGEFSYAAKNWNHEQLATPMRHLLQPPVAAAPPGHPQAHRLNMRQRQFGELQEIL